MAAASLSGSSLDLAGLPAYHAQVVVTAADGSVVSVSTQIVVKGCPFVTLIAEPNAYSHQRLMQALQNIVPDAGDPPPQPTTREQSAYMSGFEPNEDGVIVKGGCATGSCDLE